MKFTNFFKMSLILSLGGLILLASCEEEEPLTFENDPDTFCAENPFDAQCCIAEYNVDCYCSTGDNAENDTENCCLLDYNKECYCTANPDDADCAQDFGTSGLGVVIDFESGLESFAADFFNPSDQAKFDGDANISAIEGDHYSSLRDLKN